MTDLPTAPAASIPTDVFSDLDTLVAEVMAEWHIPGVALAVVRRGETPLLRSFGLRDIENGARVDPATLFPIGSITKTFTATGLALLVDEGRLDWDIPVSEIMPEFKLSDPSASANSTLRDILTHRTGLPRHDWVHQAGHLDNAGMLATLRHLEPSKPFRSAFQYQNMMYVVAGLVAERITGQRWEKFIATRILDPLGMASTATSLEAMVSRYANHASPHLFREGRLERIPVRPIHTWPSGAICASIADMASYLHFHLDPTAGRGGLRLSKAAASELSAPQIHIGRSPFLEIGDVHYGFGFEVAHYRGERGLVHGGAWSGYTAQLRLLPERGCGVAVLSNGHWHSGCGAIALAVLDRLLDLDPLPWLDRLRGPTAAERAQRRKEQAAWRTLRRGGAPASHPLADYVGEYQHDAYGVVHIEATDGALRWRGLSLDLPISHRHYECFELGADPSIWFEDMVLQFHTDRDGDIAQLSLPLEPAVAPIMFRRLPEPAMRTRAFLEPLMGVYDRCGELFRISLDDANQLTMTRGEGACQRLLPGHRGTFTRPDDPYFKLEFRRDEAGRIDAMLFHEGNGIYLVERMPAEPN